ECCECKRSAPFAIRILKIAKSQAERALSQDLKYFAKILVMARPARSTKAMRAPSTCDARWRILRLHLISDNEARKLRVLALRKCAHGKLCPGWLLFYSFVNLFYGRDTMTANAPDGVAFIERKRAKRTAVAHARYDNSAPQH